MHEAMPQLFTNVKLNPILSLELEKKIEHTLTKEKSDETTQLLDRTFSTFQNAIQEVALLLYHIAI